MEKGMELAVPILPVEDLGVAKAFYVGALGFDLIDPFGNTIFVIGPSTR